MQKVALLTVACVIGLGACSDGADPDPRVEPCSPTRIIRVGGGLPDCAFERADGTVLTLSSLRGKPVILNFWASWCRACINEMPALQRVHVTLGDRLRVIGMDALGVNGETEAFAQQFATSRGVTYPLVYDRGALLYANFAGAARRPVLPLTVFADARGIVRSVNFGELSEGDFRETIKKTLGVS
jgi:peroxiredoxin